MKRGGKQVWDMLKVKFGVKPCHSLLKIINKHPGLIRGRVINALFCLCLSLIHLSPFVMVIVSFFYSVTDIGSRNSLISSNDKVVEWRI